jgi:hypothetical protein
MGTLSTTTSRIIWIAYLIMIGVVFSFVFRETSLGLLSYTWPEVPGQVIESRGVRLRMDRNEPSSYGVRATYRYEVEGRIYTNDVIRFTMEDGTKEAAERMLKHLPPARTVGVRHAPWNPTIATLLPGVESSAYLMLGILSLLILMGIAGFVLGWRWRTRR